MGGLLPLLQCYCNCHAAPLKERNLNQNQIRPSEWIVSVTLVPCAGKVWAALHLKPLDNGLLQGLLLLGGPLLPLPKKSILMNLFKFECLIVSIPLSLLRRDCSQYVRRLLSAHHAYAGVGPHVQEARSTKGNGR